jgi:hypothetical protein
VDFEHVVGFQWDAGNARKIDDRHGVSQSEAEQAFFDANLLVAPDARHSATEPRLHALGVSFGGRLLHITFTLRSDGALIRVISARDAHRKEKQAYERKD